MSRWRIVPDLDGELSAALNVLEDVLLLLKELHSSERLAVAGPSPAAPLVLSEPAEAVARLRRAVVPSQGLSGQPGRGRLLAPDGHYEHLPMSLIEVDPGDSDVVADAVDLLGTSPAPQAVTDVADAVASDLIRPLPGCLASVADRAATFSHLQRAVALLQVTAPGDTAPDTAALRWPLTLAASGLDVALTEAQEAAYNASPPGSTRSGRTAPHWTPSATSCPPTSAGTKHGQEAMAHVEDRWEKVVSGQRIRTSRYGAGKRWRARYVDGDGRERSQTFVRKGDAERFLVAVEADLLRGTYVDPQRAKLTVGAYADRWLAAQPLRPSSRRTYEIYLHTRIVPALGSTPAAVLGLHGLPLRRPFRHQPARRPTALLEWSMLGELWPDPAEPIAGPDCDHLEALVQITERLVRHAVVAQPTARRFELTRIGRELGTAIRCQRDPQALAESRWRELVHRQAVAGQPARAGRAARWTCPVSTWHDTSTTSPQPPRTC